MIKEFEEFINDIKDNAPQFDKLVEYLEDKGVIEWTETNNIITATITYGDNDISLSFIKEPRVTKHYPYIRLWNRDYVLSSYVYVKEYGINKTYRIVHKGDRLVLN